MVVVEVEGEIGGREGGGGRGERGVPCHERDQVAAGCVANGATAKQKQ